MQDTQMSMEQFWKSNQKKVGGNIVRGEFSITEANEL